MSIKQNAMPAVPMMSMVHAAGYVSRFWSMLTMPAPLCVYVQCLFLVVFIFCLLPTVFTMTAAS
jgi:hypothetical protein